MRRIGEKNKREGGKEDVRTAGCLTHRDGSRWEVASVSSLL